MATQACSVDGWSLQTWGGSFCPATEAGNRVSGCEILVPDVSRDGRFFSTPALVSHYVAAHAYLPPQVFIDSVLAIELSREFDAVVSYDELTMSVQEMRKSYEYEVTENANPLPEEKLTERQRVYCQLGEHLRYTKWLRGHLP